MFKLKDITHDELIKIFNILNEYLEYLEVEKNKLEELDNARKSAKANRGS